ncbi:MAG: ATP-dependent zinc metalloprotease FtsH [candidate division KSB1 bacterium]|nr:ATP-dependent zinc metalloprotease FtsH [candidate division KSB1 bacterium]MDZ7275308.1 ATP-dependent zinc metalloprotease FtsH [candidate division KSB1 bacterium]MDZ7287476.1 ATP-dependent zinc metalloprotease FtsH [candidate division KSB1 bacterium]MDZ7299590.1 ATP-dependent zinc metalloprotease FtsH [candidate division KSB1 bacterium]MDZ7307472.1 ATP-dependent zinc metalloprotease FtsH [candidate division KSB1 bacterium]
MAVLLLAIWITLSWERQEPEEKQVTFSQFIELLEGQKLQKVVIRSDEIQGQLRAPMQLAVDEARQYTNIKVFLPRELSFETVSAWNSKYNIEVDVRPKTVEWWNYFLNLLPWVLVAFFWLFLLRRMQGAGTKSIFTFGRSRARLASNNRPKVTFDDVAGADEAKQELREIIEFLRDPEKFQRLGGKIPKGALLLGPPGTGKTLLAKAVAGEAGVPFFSMSGADFVEMFVGVGASRVRDLFEQGQRNAPCIIFIDEIDAVGRHRGAGLGGGHDEREQTLNQLLVEMDGFDSNEGVILIAATNRPDVLDQALLRPGRFDRQIVVDRPDVRGREGILKVHTKKIALADNVDLSVLAKGTPGFSGADLANLVNEAALLAARKNKNLVDMRDLEEAKDRVLMGAERRSLLISEKEKRITAYHEAGHVLVAKYTPGSDPIHKVTIIPRGRALGLTTSLPMDEKHNYSKSYCEALLVHLMGGREAERIIFKETTTGAGNDIERATELARRMVCDWGMSDVMGPLAFGKKQEEIFLGREIAQHRDYSELTAQKIDEEVRRIVIEASQKAHKILSDNVHQLHALATALLEKELLDGAEIDAVLNSAKSPLENADEAGNGRPTAGSESTQTQPATKV